MASEWRTSTWGDEVSLEYGKALRGHETTQGPYRVFGSNGPIGWTTEPLAPGPGVVLGRKGAYRGVEFSRDPFFVIDTAYYVVPKSELDMRWLYYAIKHYKLGDIDDGSPIPSTTRAAVYMLDLDVPTPSEQRSIARILGTLDDKIELNRRMNETMETIARALFKSWFVTFDPVHAKANGRDVGLPKAVAALFPDSFEKSEVGDIPKGWALGRFGAAVKQMRDQENPLSSPTTLFQHFSIPAFDEGQVPRPELGERIKSLKTRVPAGAVLISKLNPEIERVWLVDVRPGERAVCSTEFLVLRPRTPFTRTYVYCLACSSQFRRQIESLVTGTSKSHQRAQVDSVLNLAVVEPPPSIVAAFDRYAGGLLTRAFENRRESRLLVALRDVLLPKLISGEVRVRSAAPS